MMVSLGRTRRFLALIAAIGITSVPCVVRAQEVAVPTAAQTNASTTDRVLTRTITLHLSRVPLRDALQAIASAAQLPLSYSPRHVPGDRLVSLDAANISAADAFAIVLKGTDVEAVALADGRVALRPVEGPIVENTVPLQQGTAALAGVVTDSGTGAAIPQVTVHIDGTSLSVKSSSDGQYKFTNIAAGEYRVTARRVGYLAKTRTITVADGDNKKLDFGLNPPATQLNEVVTTALGEQRRYQVGNVISTINVDSVAPNAPITSVTDLLAARVPGLEVVQSSGLAGAGPAIRIRGQSSLLLQSDPIIIVDGIRVDNTPGNNNPINVGGPAPARINDLDFSEIESISVLKGPTATTEYGTDAANGVIVITTKRGHAGTPIWDASATESAVIIPETFSNNYWDWGHLADGTGIPMWSLNGGVPCNFGTTYYYNGSDLPAGTCLVDSITAFNPLNHAATTEYGIGPSSRYDLSVGGGTEQIRYYLAGDVQNMAGVDHLPDVFRSEAIALGYSNSALNPNSLNQSRLAANGTIQLNPHIQITVSGGYTSTYMEGPTSGGLNPQVSGPTLDDSAFGYGYWVQNNGVTANPLYYLGSMASQETEGWRGAGTVDWHPAPWLGAHLTTGIDHEAQTDVYQVLPQAELVLTNFTDTSGGEIAEDQVRNDTYTIDLAASATIGISRYLRLITTVGANYVQNTAAGVFAQAYNLSASAFSLNDAASGNTSISQSASSSATEGVYVEEQFNLGDRCFMPLALRVDAGNAFGSAVGSQNYPKWGLSCLVLTGATTLRLRGSYGAAGVQPPQGSAASFFYPRTAQFADGAPTTIYTFIWPGNPNLRPEDDREWEGGVDFTAWGSRLSLDVTAYNKYVHNDLLQIPLGYYLQGEYTENIGDLRNMGEELKVTVVPFEAPSLTASITLSGSVNHNKLLRLAPNILSEGAGAAGQYFVPGYPLYGYFGDSVRYTDQNKDGILETNEIYNELNPSSPPFLYMGSSIPITQITAQPSVAVFRHQWLQVNAVLQYEGGYKVINADGEVYGASSVSVLGAPLWLQAYNLMTNNSQFVQCCSPPANQFLSGDYLAWNELSVAIGLPAAWLRAIRIRNAHVVLGVQNLALWTTYPFGDPRVSNGFEGSLNTATNTILANNDARSASEAVVPLPRAWMVRVNLSL